MNSPTPKKHLVITGYFQRGNLGDDAMVEGLTSYLSRSLPTHTIELAPFPPSTSLNSMPAFLKRTSSASWLIFAGGTNFHDLYGLKSWRLLAQMLAVFGAARLGGVNVAYAGIGVGPIATRLGRGLVRQLLALSRSTTVRDSDSLKEANALRRDSATAGFDLALLPSKTDLTAGSSSRTRRIGVSLVAYHEMFGLDRALDLEMVGNLSTILAHEANAGRIEGVDIFPFSREGAYADLAISRELASRLEEVVAVEVVDCSSPAAVRQRMANLCAFIGARFHSILLAFEAGLPVIPILYHRKCQSLLAELKIADDAALRPEDMLKKPILKSQLESLLGDPSAFRGRLSLDDARKEAKETADRLVRAIEGEKHETDTGTLGPALPGVRRAA